MRNYFIIVSIKQSSKFEKLNDLSAYVIFLIAENAQQVIIFMLNQQWYFISLFE